MAGPLPSFPSEPWRDAKDAAALGGVGGDEAAVADARSYQRWSPVEEYADLKGAVARKVAR